MSLKLIDGSEFLHIPKTGGSWVSRVLEDMQLVTSEGWHKHANFDYNLIEDRMGSGRDLLREASRMAFRKVTSLVGNKTVAPAPFRFCFVRNPISWYESWWKYMQGLEWTDWGKENSLSKWHPCAPLNGLGATDFNVFVSNVLRKRPGFVSELYFSFVKTGVSFVGRTESLREDLRLILAQRGLGDSKLELLETAKKENVSPNPTSDVSWNIDTLMAVCLSEMPALTYFGYLEEMCRRPQYEWLSKVVYDSKGKSFLIRKGIRNTITD